MPVRTVEDILHDLNTNHGGGWIVTDGLYGVPFATSTGKNEITLHSTYGTVLKVFINSRTAEVRFYLAKIITNVPGRENL